MNKNLRKSFSELKSKCKTKSQRLAFNGLVKAFAKDSVNIDATFNGKYTEPQIIETELSDVKPGSIVLAAGRLGSGSPALFITRVKNVSNRKVEVEIPKDLSLAGGTVRSGYKKDSNGRYSIETYSLYDIIPLK